MRRISFARRRRFTLAVAVALIIGLVWVVAAAADAPDPVDVGNKAVPAIPTATATIGTCFQTTSAATPTAAQCTATNNHAIKITVQGGWLWSTHGSSCTDDRAGVGYAISWSDAGQAGNAVKSGVPTGGGGSTNVAVGAAAARSINGTLMNPADNVAHPTRNSQTGDFTGVVDPTSPTQTVVVGGKTVPAWRGGCGTAPDNYGTSGKYPGQTGYAGPLNGHGVGSGTTPNGVNQGNLPRGVWGPISHVYAQASDIGTICAITYDVHKGTDPDHNGGVGIPSGTGEDTAGGTSRNTDNGAEKNSGTPLGNACPAIIIPQPNIKVEKLPSAQTVPTGGTAHWTIRVTNNGDTDLSNIQITDSQAPNCAGGLSTLAPTANLTGWDGTTLKAAANNSGVQGTVSYTCSLDNVTAAFTNVVTACGDGAGQTVCDSDQTDVSQQGQVGIEDILSNQDVIPNDRAKMAVDDSSTTNTIEGAINPTGNFSYELFKYDGTGTDPCGTDGTSILGPLTPTASVSGTPAYLSSATSNSLKLSQLPVANPAGDADTAGSYYWKVSYPGDVVGGLTINAAFSECNEFLTINNG